MQNQNGSAVIAESAISTTVEQFAWIVCNSDSVAWSE